MIDIKKIFFAILFSLLFLTKGNAVIKDSLFATVDDKAITQSDIVNEIKTILILNAQTSYEDNEAQLRNAAVQSIVKRYVKKIEIEKYDYLEFNPADFDTELKQLASNINMDLNDFKKTFVTNGVDFSTVTDILQTELLWNSMIFYLYKDKVSVNPEEIDEQLKLIGNNDEIKEYLVSEIIIKPVPRDQLKSKIKELKERIKVEGFEKVAMDISISETAIKGGNLGWVNENIISEQFKSKIINTPVGSVSDPILLSEGILLFKVNNKRESKKFKNLEDAKQQLIEAEKTKILKMHSLSHFDNLRRSVTINYYQND